MNAPLRNIHVLRRSYWLVSILGHSMVCAETISWFVHKPYHKPYHGLCGVTRRRACRRRMLSSNGAGALPPPLSLSGARLAQRQSVSMRRVPAAVAGVPAVAGFSNSARTWTGVEGRGQARASAGRGIQMRRNRIGGQPPPARAATIGSGCGRGPQLSSSWRQPATAGSS